MTGSAMQTTRKGTKAYHIKTSVYDSGTFTSNKVNFIWFLTFFLGLNAMTFQPVKSACSFVKGNVLYHGSCL